MKRCLIIHTDGNTYNNPTLKCIIDLLREHYIDIDIRFPVSNAPMPNINGIKLLPYGIIYSIIKKIIFDKICSKTFGLISVVFEMLFYYQKYDLIIAVDRQGLIEAGFLSKLTKTPVVLFSFEIMFENETSKVFKRLERSASKFVNHWFIQDELRAKYLQI